MFDPVRPLYRWAIKTNVAYLAATVANLGVEYSFGDHYSIDLPIIYSPYTVARDYRLRFLAVQPEFRYWLKAPMKGHFFGVHLNIGAFNIAVDNKNRYQSPDGFYGVGLSYGYIIVKTRCDEVQNEMRLLEGWSSPKRKATKISHTYQTWSKYVSRFHIREDL